ncbi:hypothetical protein GCM10017607_04940 [Microbacterium thalassium]|nr:hypothetical protein GCM10017607_04940 [Microbacterium thalassium]
MREGFGGSDLAAFFAFFAAAAASSIASYALRSALVVFPIQTRLGVGAREDTPRTDSIRRIPRLANAEPVHLPFTR